MISHQLIVSSPPSRSGSWRRPGWRRCRLAGGFKWCLSWLKLPALLRDFWFGNSVRERVCCQFRSQAWLPSDWLPLDRQGKKYYILRVLHLAPENKNACCYRPVVHTCSVGEDNTVKTAGWSLNSALQRGGVPLLSLKQRGAGGHDVNVTALAYPLFQYGTEQSVSAVISFRQTDWVLMQAGLRAEVDCSSKVNRGHCVCGLGWHLHDCFHPEPIFEASVCVWGSFKEMGRNIEWISCQSSPLQL